LWQAFFDALADGQRSPSGLCLPVVTRQNPATFGLGRTDTIPRDATVNV
jgi:hypothetical protein